MRLALIFAAILMVAWIDAPMPQAKATPQDYREVLKMLRGIEDTLEELSKAKDQNEDCRGLSPEKTIRCGAEAFGVNVETALSIWRCESGWGREVGDQMNHAHHGAMQYLYSTYQSQQNAMPDIVRWYELSPAVHDMRSNMLTAIAYGSRFGWGAWSCA